jgi:hypothetical protein
MIEFTWTFNFASGSFLASIEAFHNVSLTAMGTENE